jgi:hypothetical protein
LIAKLQPSDAPIGRDVIGAAVATIFTISALIWLLPWRGIGSPAWAR